MLIIRIHVEHADRSATDSRLTDDVDAVPDKVLPPLMTPRVEQHGYLVCFWIDSR
jgi:hypothetical protein